jgi:hypothetical protein
MDPNAVSVRVIIALTQKGFVECLFPIWQKRCNPGLEQFVITNIETAGLRGVVAAQRLYGAEPLLVFTDMQSVALRASKLKRTAPTLLMFLGSPQNAPSGTEPIQNPLSLGTIEAINGLIANSL